MTQQFLLGPFSQILTLQNLPLSGPISDSELLVIEKGGVLISEGKICDIGEQSELKTKYSKVTPMPIEKELVLMPGWIDAHTHICFGGGRASDFAARLAGKTYQEIAKNGGGLIDTVHSTRAESEEDLTQGVVSRCKQLLMRGVTTCEVKSGYGLSVEDEMKMLKAISKADKQQQVSLIPTCLAAHKTPPEFTSPTEYLSFIAEDLFPQIKGWIKRVDIFVEEGAFSVEEARGYLNHAKQEGFSCVIHGDQFSKGGARLAAEIQALSVDHLECTQDEDLKHLKESGVIPIALPGASIGLGIPYAPARKILDCSLPLVLASDWNPGSAPMGNLLVQAALIAASEKLTIAETLAAVTIRAARALELKDRGTLEIGMRADMIAFPTSDYREILYYQGSMLPEICWVKGEQV